MHELEKLYWIAYDSCEGFYIVHTPQGRMQFHKDEQGLPFVNLAQSEHEAAMMLIQNAHKQMTKGTVHVQTVRGNFEGYTKKEVLQDKATQCIQAMIRNPSESDYKGIVCRIMIKNCPITPADITNIQVMFGPDLPSVQGKTVRPTPPPVVADYVVVPRSLVERNIMITLTLVGDVFFVDGTALLLMMSQNIRFVTLEHLPVQMARALVKHMERVLQMYHHARFVVRTILMDGEFETVKNLLPLIECNTTAAKEHVSKAEQMKHTVKDCTRGLVCTLPFDHIP